MKWIHSLSLVLSRFHTGNVLLCTNYVIFVHSINLLSKSHSTFRPNHLTFLPAILAGRRQERPNVHPGAPGSFPSSSPTRSQSPSYCTWQSWWLSWWQSSTQEISSTQRWLSEVGWELIQGRLVLNIIVIIIIIFTTIIMVIIIIIITDPSARGGGHPYSRPSYARLCEKIIWRL